MRSVVVAWLGLLGLMVACSDEAPLDRDAGDGADGGTTMRDGGGATDSGAMEDGGMPMPDSGCWPPGPDGWAAIDTGGPDGETVDACIARVGERTDDRVPMDQRYELVTFGGDGSALSCGGTADAAGFYVAGAQRFACGQRLRVVDAARTACAIVEARTNGPHACLEEAAQMPILAAGPAVAQQIFGTTSVGASEHREVLAALVGADNALGSCETAEPLRGFIGGACASATDCTFEGATCLGAADGWPGGHCTQDCTSSCPDRAGANAYTSCARTDDGATRCVARCDFTLFATGCRDGYGCFRRAPLAGGGDRDVCLPIECAM